MLEIISVRFQNCFSFGNEMTEVRFDSAQTTLVIGKNGGGKSSAVLDTLVYGLYGKPYRKVKLGQMINSITGRDLVVEVDLRSRGKAYRVRRGQKPAIFEVYRDGVLVDQGASVKDQQEWLEKHVLGMDYRSFTQIVILGSANHVPFMQLPAAQRREVIEDILDIQVFSQMNEVLKRRAVSLKEELALAEKNLAVAEKELEVEKRHAETDPSGSQLDSLMEERQVAEFSREKLIETLESLTKEAESLTSSIQDYESIRKKTKELEAIEVRLTDKLERLAREEEFYKHNQTCPTCRQSISMETMEREKYGRQKEETEVVAAKKVVQEKLSDLQKRVDEIVRIQTQVDRIDRDFVRTKSELSGEEHTINDLTRRIDRMMEDIVRTENSMAELEERVATSARARDELVSQAKLLAQGLVLLKDGGIKAKIVRRYIPVMNRLVNKYLAALELFVDFHLDENFNEEIRSRHRDSFSYESFSEGEKLRIDLAILFAWREIARMRNSSATDLIVFDEILDGSIDADGADYFLKLVQSLTDGGHVFIISHREGLEDKFTRSLLFVKRNNFSRLIETKN